MRLTIRLLVVLALITAAGAAPATAAPILQVNASGILTGALNVDVEGTLYDVSFLDGSCVSLFTGCDSASDFAFSTQSAAHAAARALLDQVFLNGASGDFDAIPSLTNGCGPTTPFPAACHVNTPYQLLNGTVFATYAENLPPDVDSVLLKQVLVGADFSVPNAFNNQNTYAVWTPATAVAPVPEPATMSLLGLGLAGMAARRWRKRTNAHR